MGNYETGWLMITIGKRKFVGVYLVQGQDQQGQWAYVGKGDLVRAQASLHGWSGQTVRMLATGVTDATALEIECATIEALRATGVRLRNRIGGHGIARLAPGAVLAASLTPVGPRRQLTLDDVGPALMTPLNLVRSGAHADVRPSAYREWTIARDGVHQIRQLIARGQFLRLLPVAPGGIVVASYRIIAVKSFPALGRARYFSLAPDPDAATLRGHVAPVSRQPGIRYLTPAGAGIARFLAYA